MLSAAPRFAASSAIFLAAAIMGHAAAESPSRATPSRPVSSRAAEVVRLNGVDYVELAVFCAGLGLQPRAAKSTDKKLYFEGRTGALELEVDSRDSAANGVRFFLGEAVRSFKGRVWIARIDAELLLTPILRPGLNQARIPELRTIVLDPGHGGRDAGKVNPRLNLAEKNLTLDTAARLKKLLDAQGFKVVLTRTADRYLDLIERAETAGRLRADLFISLHFNSVQSGAERTTGVEVFTLTPQLQFSTSDPSHVEVAEAKKSNPGNKSDHWNTVAGYALHREMLKALQASDRGLKRARLKVLVLAPCPAVLVESGYLSNDAEARQIGTPAYRQKIAEAIANGVRTYAAMLDAVRPERRPTSATSTAR
jgi:N-acetylmuramoyl-L-alanine amidase